MLPIHAVYFWEYLLGSKKYYISQKINIQSHHIVDSQQTTMQEQYLTL